MLLLHSKNPYLGIYSFGLNFFNRRLGKMNVIRKISKFPRKLPSFSNLCKVPEIKNHRDQLKIEEIMGLSVVVGRFGGRLVSFHFNIRLPIV